MTERVYPPNLQETDTLIKELLQDVMKWESTLSDATNLGPSATAIESLLHTKVSFGQPKDKLIKLTKNSFQKIGVELNEIYKRQMHEQYDFYYMTVPINLRPRPGAQFRLLACELEFGPKGELEPIVQSIFPKSEWRTVMNLGINMDLALNENLDWKIGVDASKIVELANLPGNFEANIANRNELGAFVVMPNYKHEIGQFEIVAYGESSSICYWRIQDQNLLKISAVELALVFKVPKGTTSFSLHGTTWAEPNMNWLTADLRDIFRDLSERFQQHLRHKQECARQFSRGETKEWTLSLP